MSARGVVGLVTDGRSTRSAGEVREATPQPEPGEILAGKFRVDGLLGRGGMGIVYRALHLVLGEPVALKLLSNEGARRPDAVARFLREARACARIKSPNVVRVLDAGTLDDGTPYVAMELLDGRDLAAIIREGSLVSVRDAVGWVLQACEALSEAHALGIVHRDIKPSNLFLSGGTVKVLDFGIAKSAEPTPEPVETLTASTTVLGSPAYMAPEQIRRANNVDARADIWSLAVVLFELLSARLPFDGESSAALLAAISADRPRSLRPLRADVPRGLERVIARCLERRPERRPADVHELVELLAPFAGQAPARAKHRGPYLVVGALAVITGAAVLYGRSSVESRMRPATRSVSSFAAAASVAAAPTPSLSGEEAVLDPAKTPSAAPARSARATVLPQRKSPEAELATATAHRK